MALTERRPIRRRPKSRAKSVFASDLADELEKLEAEALADDDEPVPY
jgi:hypothetical protein